MVFLGFFALPRIITTLGFRNERIRRRISSKRRISSLYPPDTLTPHSCSRVGPVYIFAGYAHFFAGYARSPNKLASVFGENKNH